MSQTEASRFRGVAARINFLAQDRADIQFAAKELSRRMAVPVRSDWEAAKKIARYFKHRPRAVQVFRFEQGGDALTRYADSDWVG